ncbi:beta-aspartyl-peptidase [Clostridium omnivorum]|uniref:Isoaspartyl dipeptidase n=1 Tax=Clostridium omnivorum TaxID=1604902 RepID=A0ABQ5N8L3_9CLOT|nr:beta-aspartyl-peptidase [Clostridium sp. E14]GLC31375.1 isoaspartyl dipeptidase [Clostridium sp. E14]
MIKLIKGAKIYAPEYRGVKDVLLIGNKIAALEESINLGEIPGVEVKVIDGSSKLLVPGFIDGHVHILGGGGEGGFKTRTPEITLSDITKGGVTTVVGCLGTDGLSRNMVSLLAKAKGLEEEGINTFIYTGSYKVPVTTLTGDVMKDLIAIDKVIGVGEVAISDHRSSQPEYEDIKKLTADARVGGILSGKAGIVNMHLGDGKDMINYLFDIVQNTEIPFTQFLPTHMNRNPHLFEEAIRYAKAGGHVDFTTSSVPSFWEDGEVRASKALKRCLEAGVPIEHITFTSDGQGSLPMFDENKQFTGLQVGKVTSLFEEVKQAVLSENVQFEDAIKVITANPAEILKLKGKGRIAKGYDADVVLLDEKDLSIDTVIAKGRIMIEEGQVQVLGTFE